ncbi:heme o synthase [Streptomyces sp. HU2014]|uniref:Protoheme IX farnesyltransferase n=1 Tax=Streptomyces albireticuli TaxID=1940 RepID=A0A1Z2LDY7_9ACTN|nr:MULTISPECIES: heme o synthase [Streptomyces]ARZ72485.1 protoheme IX farnesyltransferase [Streptomyces albireticuli]UQI45834.1 heme o synthase [Streptomyces sp. HU2014]
MDHALDRAVPTSPPGPRPRSRSGELPIPDRPTSAARVAGFVALTKPRIIELLLVTTIPVMFLAAGGVPDLTLVLATCTGGYLSAGSACAFNMYLDRDIDARMDRTANRPLVTGVVSPRECLVFASALALASVGWLWCLVNPLSAVLAFGALLFYTVVYTMLLKRRTSQNIVWGGLAGGMPVLIGWSAVTGSVSWTAVALCLVVFFWTPPHYWPLSMKTRADYARVGVPMLPVVAGITTVTRQIVLYSWLMVAMSLSLGLLGRVGWFFTCVAAGLGCCWLREAHALHTRAKAGLRGPGLQEMRLFHWSISYISLLFTAIAVDPFLR